jgi:hypothetical protein
MSSFDSLAEIRRLGAPVVRLFRVALGRDPDPIELQHYASRLRQGAALQDLATDMTRSIEFRRRDATQMQTRLLWLESPRTPSPKAPRVMRLAWHCRPRQNWERTRETS